MRNRRMLPQWISNLALASVFVFCYLILSCKVIVISYKVSDLEKQLQQLRNWNQYYRSQILKEMSFEKVKLRAEKLNLSLEVPDKWSIVQINEPEDSQGNNNYANAEEKNSN